MKLQIDGQALRLRLSEAELGLLIATGGLQNTLACPTGGVAQRRLALRRELAAPAVHGDLMALQIELPHAAFVAFAAERPRRDGFEFATGGLEISIEVDVRDSRKLMQVKRTKENPPD